MKTFIFCAIISLSILGSCQKYDCISPNRSNVNNNDSTSAKTYSVTITGSDFLDAQLSSLHPSTNYSTYPSNIAAAWTLSGTPYTERGFINFNYSSIPSGAKIQKATLTLMADTVYASYHGHNSLSGPNNWVFGRATAATNVTTITWDNQPNLDASTAISLAASTNYDQTYQIDITNFVQEDITNPSTAYGFIFELVTESYYRDIIFASSEHPNTSIRPKLDVVYTK